MYYNGYIRLYTVTVADIVLAVAVAGVALHSVGNI